MLWASIQEWVLESLLVPYALLVEDEELSGLHIPEHEVFVEQVSGPHEVVFDGFSGHLLKIFDVDDVLVNLPKH